MKTTGATSRRSVSILAAWLAGLVPAVAGAQGYEDAPAAPLVGGTSPDAQPTTPPPAPAAAADEAVESDDAGAEPPPIEDERYEELKEEVRQLRGVVAGRKPTVTLSGYADVGFFAAQGDGTGFVQDLGSPAMRAFPQYAGRYGWVFLGDLLATPINSRGEPADLGNPPGADRADLIDSNGAPSFIVNEVNLTLNSVLADNVLGTSSINFIPRTGGDFRLGDVFDVDLASLEWLVGRERRTSIFIGKFNSVIGIEYQTRKANQRFGITPSFDRALHGRHADRHQGAEQARPERHVHARRRAHQRLVGHRAISLLRRDRQQRGQDRQRPDRDRAAASVSRSSSACRACMARRIARWTASIRSGFRAPICSC